MRTVLLWACLGSGGNMNVTALTLLILCLTGRHFCVLGILLPSTGLSYVQMPILQAGWWHNEYSWHWSFSYPPHFTCPLSSCRKPCCQPCVRYEAHSLVTSPFRNHFQSFSAACVMQMKWDAMGHLMYVGITTYIREGLMFVNLSSILKIS